MIEKLIALIRANIDITNLIKDNLFIGRVQYESGLPAMMLYIEDNSPTVSKDSDRVLDRYIVRINIYSDTYSELNDLNNLLRLMFNGYVCDDIKGIIYEDENDFFEENTDLMIKSVSFLVLY